MAAEPPNHLQKMRQKPKEYLFFWGGGETTVSQNPNHSHPPKLYWQINTYKPPQFYDFRMALV